jgi:hypothetical protein
MSAFGTKRIPCIQGTLNNLDAGFGKTLRSFRAGIWENNVNFCKNFEGVMCAENFSPWAMSKDSEIFPYESLSKGFLSC